MNVFTDILRISVQSLLTRIVKHIYKEECTAPLALAHVHLYMKPCD